MNASGTLSAVISVPASPIGRILPRKAMRTVTDALMDTRVVLVNGARQSGKSTLVATVCRDRRATWRNLDRPNDRAAARSDPTEFVHADTMLVIDEIQRDPELLLAIKASVDEDPRPGKFLVTGSARVMGLRALPDVLPGRMETIELWPLSQGEIDGAPVGSARGAVGALLPLRFPGPPAEPGVRFSPHRALHVKEAGQRAQAAGSTFHGVGIR